MGRVGITGGDIAGTTRGKLEGDRLVAGFLKGFDHLKYAIALAGSQIIGNQARIGSEFIQCLEVAYGKVNYMDIVAHTCAVDRGVVIAEYAEFIALADGNLGDKGHQIVGDIVGIFTDAAALVGADRVEITQAGDVPAGIGRGQIRQNMFHHQLGLT